MTETEKMVRAMNGFFKEMGEDELPFPTGGKPESELEMLRNVKEEVQEASAGEDSSIQVTSF